MSSVSPELDSAAGAKAGPTLPTELLAEIITLAVQTPKFDFLEPDWAEGVQTGTLYSLCLVSRTFDILATPHLYSHPILATAAAARAFLRTTNSDKWQTGHNAAKAGQRIRRLTLGQEVELGQELDGDFAVEVLNELAGFEMEAVEMIGLSLGADPFAGLTGKQHVSNSAVLRSAC